MEQHVWNSKPRWVDDGINIQSCSRVSHPPWLWNMTRSRSGIRWTESIILMSLFAFPRRLLRVPAQKSAGGKEKCRNPEMQQGPNREIHQMSPANGFQGPPAPQHPIRIHDGKIVLPFFTSHVPCSDTQWTIKPVTDKQSSLRHHLTSSLAQQNNFSFWEY